MSAVSVDPTVGAQTDTAADAPSRSPEIKPSRWASVVRPVTTLILLMAVVFPIASLIVQSFARSWFFPDVLPSKWSTEAWSYVFGSSSGVFSALWNSIQAAVLVTVLAIIIGLPASRALGQNEFRGKRAVEWLLMMPILVPPMVAVMGIHIIFLKAHLTGNLLGVALVHLIPSIPYFVLVMSSVFAGYGVELEETARTLGANKFQVFTRVTLPAISSGLFVAGLFTFLISWSQYVTTLLVGSGQFQTLPLVLFPFLAGSDKATGAAITLIFVAPAILVLIFTSRSLGRGSTVMGGFGKL